MFDGFQDARVDVGDDVRLRVRWAGDGPALLLLHGHPRTAATWHRVAPVLVTAGYTVICPDLRGYGRSSKPATAADHSPYSKRVMAEDMRRLLDVLGFDSAIVVGHDRGSYVALRLALDHPDLVRRLVVMDSVPISEALDRCGATFARLWWHWFFFAQPDKPERAINADPDAWYGGDPEVMGAEAYAEYRDAIHDPQTVRAMLEDYRAGLGVDYADETADRAAGRRVECPTLLLWSTNDDLLDLYGDPLAIWRVWALDVEGHGIESGHHIAEEAPDALTHAVLGWLDPSSG